MLIPKSELADLPCTRCGVRKRQHKISRCRECCAERARELRADPKHRPRIKATARRYYQRNAEARRQYAKNRRALGLTPARAKQDPWHSAVQRRVFRAVQSGVLIVPGRCSACGVQSKLDAHHEDYSRPLDVTWLCRACHKQRHSLLEQAG